MYIFACCSLNLDSRKGLDEKEKAVNEYAFYYVVDDWSSHSFRWKTHIFLVVHVY